MVQEFRPGNIFTNRDESHRSASGPTHRQIFRQMYEKIHYWEEVKMGSGYCPERIRLLTSDIVVSVATLRAAVGGGPLVGTAR